MNISHVLIINKETKLDYAMVDYNEQNIDTLLHILKDERQDTKILLEEHDSQRKTLDQVTRLLQQHNINYTIIQKSQSKKNDYQNTDLIMPVGGDGTFLGAAPYVEDERMFFGVNSYPQLSSGRFMAATKETFEKKFSNFLAGDFEIESIPRLKATIRDSHETYGYALNEIYVGKFARMDMARYFIKANDTEEYQMTSGVIAALKEGAPAWQMNENRAQRFDGNEDKIQWVSTTPKNQGRDYRMLNGFSDHIIIKSADYKLVVSIDSNKSDYLFTLKTGQEVLIEKSDRPINRVSEVAL
ncbi:MAG: hypothetical protein WC916_07545 [Candidatus Woesearchaeota archaeon]